MGGENLRRLKALLAELFMFDQADLDFGIYRIMNLRREEIRRFLDEDLLPQVREALGMTSLRANAQATERRAPRALEKRELRDELGIEPSRRPAASGSFMRAHVGTRSPTSPPAEGGGVQPPRHLLPPLLQGRRLHLASAATRRAYTPSRTRARRSSSTGPMRTSTT